VIDQGIDETVTHACEGLKALAIEQPEPGSRLIEEQHGSCPFDAFINGANRFDRLAEWCCRAEWAQSGCRDADDHPAIGTLPLQKIGQLGQDVPYPVARAVLEDSDARRHVARDTTDGRDCGVCETGVDGSSHVHLEEADVRSRPRRRRHPARLPLKEYGAPRLPEIDAVSSKRFDELLRVLFLCEEFPEERCSRALKMLDPIAFVYQVESDELLGRGERHLRQFVT